MERSYTGDSRTRSKRNAVGQIPENPPSQQQKSSLLLQDHPARSNAEESLVDRGEPQGAFLPGVQAFQQNGSGWYTTTITVNHGDQRGAVTLHDLLGPQGHFDLEHGDLRDFLEHMQQLEGLARAQRGNLALDRIAQAGPQDFTEVSSRYTELLCAGDGSTASSLFFERNRLIRLYRTLPGVQCVCACSKKALRMLSGIC